MPTYLALPLVFAAFTLALYMLYKVRAVHLMLYAMQDRSRHELSALFRQIETLHSLYLDLDLRKSLPPTRGFAGSPDFLRELTHHALSKKPKTIVECSSGVSTLVLARCMQLNGQGMVYSMEHDPEYAQKTRALLQNHGLAGWACVIDAPLGTYRFKGEEWPWYSTQNLPHDLQIDMLVIDGPPMNIRPLSRYPAGPILFPRLAGHGAVFLDDAAREDETEILRFWRAEFPDLRQTDLYCEKGCIALHKTPL